jgi:hypothetical protein
VPSLEYCLLALSQASMLARRPRLPRSFGVGVGPSGGEGVPEPISEAAATDSCVAHVAQERIFRVRI